MTVGEALLEASARFALLPPEGPASLSAQLDARVLWEHVSGWSQAQLITHENETLDGGLIDAWQVAVARRCRGEPVAYITQKKEFYGLDFEVEPGVLVPRPDTETLVEAGLRTWRDWRRQRWQGTFDVLDVCTGTGCVALALASVLQTDQTGLKWSIEATDISPIAFEIAQRNASRLAPGRVTVHQQDLLGELVGPWDLIVSNPPYLTSAETALRLGSLGWKEPELALEGGLDGLDLVRRLISQSAQKLKEHGWLWLEAAPAQMHSIRRLLEQAGLKEITVIADLAGFDRVIGACYRSNPTV